MKAVELIRPDAEAEPAVVTVETAESGEAARALQYAKDHILDCVRGQQGLRKAIRKDEFEDAFARYEEAHAPVFRQLEAACPDVTYTIETMEASSSVDFLRTRGFLE